MAQLRDRYRPTDLFALVPQLGLRFEPQLAQLDRLLDDDELFGRVRGDLARRHPNTRTRGRPSTPVEVILRLLVVMRLYGWSYEQAEYFVNDSLVLRQFCRLYPEKVPDDTTLIRWANLIGPDTLQRRNDRVVQLARTLKVTRGRKLRVDTTAVETSIHYPTDSGLLGDGVRVVSRLPRRAKAALGGATEPGRQAFRSRVRAVGGSGRCPGPRGRRPGGWPASWGSSCPG
jgi:IS5 family transposase